MRKHEMPIKYIQAPIEHLDVTYAGFASILPSVFNSDNLFAYPLELVPGIDGQFQPNCINIHSWHIVEMEEEG